jgi:hypothetical protein
MQNLGSSQFIHITGNEKSCLEKNSKGMAK